MKQCSPWSWSPGSAGKQEAERGCKSCLEKGLCVLVDVSKVQHSCLCFLCWLAQQSKAEQDRFKAITAAMLLLELWWLHSLSL